MSDLYVGLGSSKPYQGYEFIDPPAEVGDANPIAEVGTLDFDLSENSSSSPSSSSLGSWLQNLGERIASKFQSDDGDERVGLVACSAPSRKSRRASDASRSLPVAKRPLRPSPATPLPPLNLPQLPVAKSAIIAILKKAWAHYKKFVIAPDGRPYSDPDNNDIDGDGNKRERTTVSEAVSYVLLRAIWMKDKATFDKVWLWSKKNMQRINLDKVYYWNKNQWVNPPQKDHLFAWRYIPSLKGRKGGVIHYTWKGEKVWRGCFEAASDADLDITAALIFASRVWNDAKYLTEAKKILTDMWNKYVRKVGNNYYLAAGDQFKTMGEVNPSYMRPSYYEIFAAVDPAHPWKKLTVPSYQVIVKSGDLTLKDENSRAIPSTTNLPPNWVDISNTGTYTDSDIFMKQGGHLFGWDAFRTLFFVAEDYAWFRSPVAKRYLTDNKCSTADYGPYCFLNRQLVANGKINAGFTRNGTAVARSGWWSNNLNKEQFAMYGVYLPYFYFGGNGQAAKKIFTRLQSLYNNQGYWGNNKHDYYGQNWAWFGLALISGVAKNYYPVSGISRRTEKLTLAQPTATPISAPTPPARTATPAVPTTAPAKLSSIRKKLITRGVSASAGGYNGGGGKVRVNTAKGGIVVTSNATGNDVGINVQFPAIRVGNNTHLIFAIKGKVHHKGGWAKWGSVQIIDGSGKRHILRPLCQSVYGDCTQDLVVKPTGRRHIIKIKLPRGIKSIKHFEIVFPGNTIVYRGFTVSNLGLGK